MSTATINIHPQFAKLPSQISELVQQYANIDYAPKLFVSGQSAVPLLGFVIETKGHRLMVDASLDGWPIAPQLKT